MASTASFDKVKTTLRKASRAAVEDAARHRFKVNLRTKQWLAKSSRYRSELIEKIKNDNKNATVRQGALRDYIVASGPLHVIDGWSFLGRAADALLRGDPTSCIHLAYYAELRAAVGLLALDGIGVFDSTHALLDDSGKVTLFKTDRTHSFVWPALDWWSRPKGIQQRLLGLLRPGGITIWDCLVGFKAGTSAAPIGQRWLRTWGLDLRKLTDDRFSRNEVSYRPSQFRIVSPAPTRDVVDFITSLWRLLEPSANGSFDNLDRFLLRIAVESAFLGVTGTTATSRPEAFEHAVNAMLKHLGLDEPNAAVWVKFFRRQEHPHDPLPITAANEKTFASDGSLAIQVISRAALLLRLATASAQDLLRSASVKQTDLAFWWHPFGVERGFWLPGQQPAQVSDSWVDVLAFVTGAEAWRKSPGVDVTQVGLRSDQAGEVLGLGSFELVSLWGLAS